MGIRRSIWTIVAFAFVVAACGGSASTPSLVDSSGVSSGSSSVSPGSSSAASAGLPDLPAAGGGSCKVAVTGDTAVSWDSPQTTGTLLVTYWLDQSDRDFLSLGAGEEYLLMNCQSDKGTVSLYTTNNTTGAQFPESTGTYVIEAGGILSESKPGEIQALVTFPDKSLWRVTDPGVFEVKTFDAGHFAGTFTLKIGKESEDLQSIVGTATVTGTFDLACTGSACK